MIDGRLPLPIATPARVDQHPVREGGNPAGCAWKKVARYGIALGTGIMFAAIFCKSTALIVACVLVGGALIAVSIVALNLLSQMNRRRAGQTPLVVHRQHPPISSVAPAVSAVSNVPSSNDAVVSRITKAANADPKSESEKEKKLPRISEGDEDAESDLVEVEKIEHSGSNQLPAPIADTGSSDLANPTDPYRDREVEAKSKEEVTLPQAIKMVPEIFKKVAAEKKLLSVQELIKGYSECWEPGAKLKYMSELNPDGEVNDFDRTHPFLTADLSRKRLSQVLEFHNSVFPNSTDYEKEFGFIQKHDVPPGTQIYVRADLHGDLKSVLENLRQLQKDGLLDENFKCKPHTQLVFLGDYVDRGYYSLQIVELLAVLKIENPEQVHLIRGNHEYTEYNAIQGDKKLQEYLMKDSKTPNKENCKLLTAFYERMPLTLYVAEADEKCVKDKEYVQFTHGTVELHTDASLILDSKFDEYTVSRKRTGLSARVLDLYTQPLPVRTASMTDDQLKHLKLAEAAKRIGELLTTIGFAYDNPLTMYNWGDLSSSAISELDPSREDGGRGSSLWKLSAEDIQHYFNLSSSLNKVVMLIRGHEHIFGHLKDKDGKVIATTLSIGVDADPSYIDRVMANHVHKFDRAYVLSTKPKVDQWTKKVYLREQGSSDTVVLDPMPLRSDSF